MVSVKPKSSIIHILPIFERCGDRAYNVKASVTNRKLEDICEETGIHFIKMNKISSESYTRDGVHFNNTGRKNLVIMIKQPQSSSRDETIWSVPKQSQRQENYQEQHHQNSKREYPQRKQHHNQWQTNEEKRWYNQRNTQHTSDRPHQNNHPKQIHQQITVVPEHPGENKQGISNERALWTIVKICLETWKVNMTPNI